LASAAIWAAVGEAFSTVSPPVVDGSPEDDEFDEPVLLNLSLKLQAATARTSKTIPGMCFMDILNIIQRVEKQGPFTLNRARVSNILVDSRLLPVKQSAPDPRD